MVGYWCLKIIDLFVDEEWGEMYYVVKNHKLKIYV